MRVPPTNNAARRSAPWLQSGIILGMCLFSLSLLLLMPSSLHTVFVLWVWPALVIVLLFAGSMILSHSWHYVQALVPIFPTALVGLLIEVGSVLFLGGFFIEAWADDSLRVERNGPESILLFWLLYAFLSFVFLCRQRIPVQIAGSLLFLCWEGLLGTGGVVAYDSIASWHILNEHAVGVIWQGCVIGLIALALLVGLVALRRNRPAGENQSEREELYHLSVYVPDLNTLSEGEILLWYVASGDIVQADQRLVTIQVDERRFDILTPQNGILLEIWREEGKNVDAGDVLCVIGVKPAEI